jgi:ATP-dependent exoDNAse (exonuclease V) beta subunit
MKKKKLVVKYDYFSHSGKSTFEQCPRKWKLKYVDKIKVEIDQTYLSLGNACHEVLELWQGGSKSDFLKLVHKMFKKYELNKYWESDIVTPMIINCRNFYNTHIKPFNDRCMHEMNFKMQIGPYTAPGKIDFIKKPLFDADGNLEERGVIVDYKTSKKAKIDSKMRDQLMIYTEAVMREFPEYKVDHFDFGIYFIRHDDLSFTNFDEDDVEDYIIDFERKCNRVQTSAFEKRTGPLCGQWCEYCPDYCQGKDGED